MKKIISYILFASLVLGYHAATAQKEPPPEGGKPKDFHLAPQKEEKLANGLRAVMVSYGTIPKVSISLIIKTGNVHEGPNQVWLADLTGKMIQEGTMQMNAKALSKKAASMGGQINVSVGADQTVISGSVLSEFAADFITTIADMIMHPAFPPAELQRLKEDLKRQLAVQKGIPQLQAQEKFFQAVYKDHPYGRFFPTEEMINSYTLDMVKDFYQNNFGAQRSVLYVVGSFDENAVRKAVDKAFSQWQKGPEVSYPPVHPSYGHDTIIIDRKNAPQTTVIVGMPILTPRDSNYIPLMVTNSLLGGSFGSRITSNIRENKGYTYSPYSTVQNQHEGSVWYEQADVTSEHTIDAINEIQKEINRLQVNPPSEEELKGIQRYEAGIFVLRNSSPGGIINQLNFVDQYGLDGNYLTNYVQNVYKVTPEKVSAITKDHIRFEDMPLIMVGDKAAIEKQISQQKDNKKAF